MIAFDTAVAAASAWGTGAAPAGGKGVATAGSTASGTLGNTAGSTAAAVGGTVSVPVAGQVVSALATHTGEASAALHAPAAAAGSWAGVSDTETASALCSMLTKAGARRPAGDVRKQDQEPSLRAWFHEGEPAPCGFPPFQHRPGLVCPQNPSGSEAIAALQRAIANAHVAGATSPTFRPFPPSTIIHHPASPKQTPALQQRMAFMGSPTSRPHSPLVPPRSPPFAPIQPTLAAAIHAAGGGPGWQSVAPVIPCANQPLSPTMTQQRSLGQKSNALAPRCLLPPAGTIAAAGLPASCLSQLGGYGGAGLLGHGLGWVEEAQADEVVVKSALDVLATEGGVKFGYGGNMSQAGTSMARQLTFNPHGKAGLLSWELAAPVPDQAKGPATWDVAKAGNGVMGRTASVSTAATRDAQRMSSIIDQLQKGQMAMKW